MVNLQRRIAQPLKVEGVGRGRLVTIQTKDFQRLRVDESYQRVRITGHVNSILHALKSGGIVPDPISIAERQNGDWYIVDGQQRFAAHLDADVPMTAMIYTVEHIDAEKALFLALNRGVRVGTDFIVHAWPGEIAEILRKANDSPTHQLFNKIDFGRHGTRHSASTLARGMVGAMTPADWATRGRIEDVLGRGDSLLKQPGARHRAESLLSVLAGAFNGGHLPAIVSRAIGAVAYERWAERVTLPSASTYARFRKTNWTTLVPSTADRYFVVMKAEVSKRWR
jgi:hypothetical protein